METRLLSPQSKKSQQLASGDCISDLPETVTSDILSRLPIKDAVKTSMLSKDWEYKWTLLYNARISDLERLSEQNEASVDIVGRMYFSRDFKSFSLLHPAIRYCNVLVTLMSGALKCNVESFELETREPKGFVLPRNLVNNTLLTSLKLNSSCIFKVPMDNCFPNLTYLQLKYVEIMNKVANSDRLVFTFPVLKTFELMYCKWTNVSLVEIFSPSLSTFVCKTSWLSNEDSGYSIKICGARLENFESVGGFPENIMFCESVVLNATLDCNEISTPLSGMQFLKLLNGFSSSITDLNLSHRVYEAIAISKHEVPLPQFSMLQRLSINVYRNAKVLIELLHSAPALKYLHIACSKPEEYDSNGVDSVPDCVVNHLQEVTFVYDGHTKPIHYEKLVIHLGRFFQKHGVELKKIYMHESLLKFFGR